MSKKFTKYTIPAGSQWEKRMRRSRVKVFAMGAMVPIARPRAPRRGQADNATAMRTLDRLLQAIPTALVLSASRRRGVTSKPARSGRRRAAPKDHAPQLLVLQARAPHAGRRRGAGSQITGASGSACRTGKCGDQFSPLAISKSALDQSVDQLLGNTRSVARLRRRATGSGKTGIAKGAPVTITVPLADALDQIQGGSKIQVK